MKTRAIALGGMLAALSWLFLILIGIVPTGRLFLLYLSSLCLVIAGEHISFSYQVAMGCVVALLSLIFPGLIIMILYSSFFGSYPLFAKYISQKTKRFWPALLWRHFFATILIFFGVYYLGIRVVLHLKWEMLGIWWYPCLFALLQLAILGYDFITARFLGYYNEAIAPKIFKEKI